MVEERIDIRPALQMLRAVLSCAEARRRVARLPMACGQVVQERIGARSGNVLIVSKVELAVEQLDWVTPLSSLAMLQEVRERAVR